MHVKRFNFFENIERDNSLSVLWCAKRVIALFAVVGALLGFGLTFVIPAQWEAVSVLEVGQVDTGGTAPVQIESTARAAERMRLAQFQDAVFQAVGYSQNEDSDKAAATVLRGAVKVVLLRNADLIQLTARGFTSKQAADVASAYEKELANYHAKIAEPTIRKLRAELQDVEQNIAIEEGRRKSIRQMMEGQEKGAMTRKFSENVLLTQMGAENATLLRTLELRRISLREQLNPARTFNTRSVGAIDVSAGPIYPKRLFFIVGGVVLSLAIACAIVLLRAMAGAGLTSARRP